MYETVYFILNIDEKSKIINVDQKIFSANIDRNEYKNALLEQRKIYVMCSNEGYQVNYEGKPVPYFEEAKKEFYFKLEEIEQRRLEREAEEKKIKEIREKDLLDLTEEEIIILAKANVKPSRSTFDYFNLTRYDHTLHKGTTFTEEYEKLIEKIETKKVHQKGGKS